MSQSPQISTIHTPCKSCVFAKYEDKTQTDCHLDYISKYRANGVEIIEAYDEDNEFFVINDKKCIGYRENKWFEKRNLGDASIEQKINKYKESNYAHYIAVINLKELELDNLANICNNLNKCDIRPKKVVLIRYQNDKKNFHYRDIENIFSSTNIDYPWRIQTMLDTDMPYEYILYDIVKNNKNCRFVLSIQQDTDSLNKLINTANQTVYENLENFYASGDSTKKVILYSSTVYRHAFEVGKDLLNDPDLYTLS